MILINNCPYNNGVYTILDKKKKLVIKSAFTKDGIQRVINEYSGYRWFLKRTNKNNLKWLFQQQI